MHDRWHQCVGADHYGKPSPRQQLQKQMKNETKKKKLNDVYKVSQWEFETKDT